MEDLILQRYWSLWHDIMWTDLRLVGSFGTVVEFWKLFNAIADVSNLEHKTNLRLFIKNVKPTREDETNANGGQWIVQFYRDSFIDDIFINLVLDTIGGNLEHLNVTGIELNVRDRGHRISMWTKNYDSTFFETLNQTCGKSVVSIVYKRHKDIVDNHSTFKATSTFAFKKPVLKTLKKLV